MAKIQKITATNAKNNFSEILDRIVYYGESFIIERHNKPIATISAPIVKDATQNPGVAFLLKLAEKSSKNEKVPKDLAANLDKYLWDDDK